MRRYFPVLVLAVLGLLMTACEDNDPVKPTEFAVTIRVSDAAGNPVEGLRVGLVNDHPFFQDGFGAVRAGPEVPYSAAVAIPFKTAATARIRMTIEDIEGRAIRMLGDGDFLSGSHSWLWDGRNDAGDLQPSGRYTAHLEAMDIESDELVFEDRTDMLLSMLDSSRVPAGFTNQKGYLVLKDRKLFPQLYDLPEMVATNENGQPIGSLVPTSWMRISLVDTAGGGHMAFKREVPGTILLDLVWNPQRTAAEEIGNSGKGAFPGMASPDMVQPGEPVFELGPAYPNPFN